MYMLVHEFAHYIDRSLTPNIIPDKYNFLCETFSFYMERQLENYLLKQKEFYDEFIKALMVAIEKKTKKNGDN